MGNPIILGFEDGGLSDNYAIAVGVGGSYGKASLPLVALDFSREKINRVFPNSNIPEGLSNEQFYKIYYSILGLHDKKVFWNPAVKIEKTIFGFVIGLPSGSIVKSLEDLASSMLKNIVAKILSKIATTVSIPLQLSVSSDALLYGRNLETTYNLDINNFNNNNIDVVIVQAGAGFIFQSAVNLLFICPRQVMPQKTHQDALLALENPGLTVIKDAAKAPLATIRYLCNAISSYYAVATIFDGVIGPIPPSLQIQIMAS